MIDPFAQDPADRLKPHLTPEFLSTLAEVARIYGWEGDYQEIGQFVENLHRYAGVEPPDLEPYTCEGD